MAPQNAKYNFFSLLGSPISLEEPQTNDRQRILVVDDDPDICRLNAEILIYSGYQVDTVASGEAAWNALQLNHYDLIISDNKMEGFTGVDLIKKLKAKSIDVPVLLVTGNLPEPESAGFLTETTILLKPYSFDVLLNTVRNFLG